MEHKPSSPSPPLGERVAKLEAIVPLVHEELARMRKLIENNFDDLQDQLEKQNERITTLERWRAGLVSMGALIGSIVSLVAKYLLDLLIGGRN